MSPCTDLASSTPANQVPGSRPTWVAAARLVGGAAPSGEGELPGCHPLLSFINPHE